MKKFKEIKDWYEINERRVSVLSLLGGFVFDALTLQRIDALRDNLWIAVNLAIVGLCIVLLNKRDNERRSTESSYHFWLFNIL